MIFYRSPAEIEALERANALVLKVLDALEKMVAPGVTTWDLDRVSEEMALKAGARPAFKGYRGYTRSLCASINEEVIHGIPSKKRELKEGDIVSLDFGVLYNGFYGDATRTYAVGEISPLARRLMQAAEQAFWRGVEQMVEGNRLSDISHAIQRHVEAQGFSVIRSFVGHGIGQAIHEEPQVPNFGFPGRGPRLRKGLVLAIEPMIAAGDWEVEILADGWTAVTRDRSLAAHYEETVALTERGAEVLSAVDGAGAPARKELPHA